VVDDVVVVNTIDNHARFGMDHWLDFDHQPREIILKVLPLFVAVPILGKRPCNPSSPAIVGK